MTDRPIIERTLFDDMTGASFSDCRKYRYKLWRKWDDGGLVNFTMLNPSKAGEIDSDRTVNRCIGFARRWGYGGIVVTNLFGMVTPYPSEMIYADDPIGPGNDAAIVEAADESAIVICAWGADGDHRDRASQVRKMLLEHCPDKLHYLRMGKNQPWHPLYLPGDLKPIRWGQS